MATPLAEVDLTDLDNFAGGFPHELFVVHRREAPVWWHRPTGHTPDGEGFWSVAGHAACLEVLRDPATYSSERGGDRDRGGTLLADSPYAGLVLNMMDDPRHARIRRLVSAGLTPRTLLRVEDQLRAQARLLIDRIVADEPFDVLGVVAAELPMRMICLLLGVPVAERHWLFETVEPGFDFRVEDRSPATEAAHSQARARMRHYGRELIATKRAAPGDDMLSTVVHATLPDADPPRMTDDELYMFFSLVFTAGSETTRNAIAGGLLALAEHPDQLGALRSDLSLLPSAIEEILRWTTPSPAKRRTATRESVLGGQRIGAGDKVLIWEGSANRDELVFDRAHEFDISRDPNPHLGFGHGVHFCLGAGLARLEMRVLLEELLPRFERYDVAGPVEWTRSNRHTGIRHLHLSLGRAR